MKTTETNKKCFRQPNSTPNDECYTPVNVVYDELSKWAELGKFVGKKIICPCDSEESAFVKVLKQYQNEWGIKSIDYSHIDDGIGFEDIDYSQYDIVITNPPFSKYKSFFDYIQNIDYLLIAPTLNRASRPQIKLMENHKSWLGYGRHLGVDFQQPLYLGFNRDKNIDFAQPDNKIIRVCIDWITSWPEAQDEVNKRPFITVGKNGPYEIMENIPEKPIICKPWRTIPPGYTGYCFCGLGILDRLPMDKYYYRIINDTKVLKHNGKNVFSGVLIKKK